MATVTIEEKLLSKQNSRNIIRAKLVECGLATSTDKLETLATIVDNIVNRGAVSVSIKEGETYAIPAGYHSGGGTISGVAGGGDYKLEPTKTVTPTKQQQAITPASGFYGMEGVTVLAIPEIYQDVSSVTAVAGDVLSSKVIVLADGSIIAGTMVDNGAVTKVLDATTISYTVPKGYHGGNGKISITLETKTVTPTKSTQKITPSTGKVLSEVTVNPIPAEYITTDDADAVAGDIVKNKTAYVDGNKVTGTMTDNGTVSKALNCGESYTIPAGKHSGTGKVTANSLASQTQATAAAAEILDNETAWVNGVKVEGTMPNNGAVSGSVNGITTNSVTVPAGYTTGGSVTFDDTKICEMLDAI